MTADNRFRTIAVAVATAIAMVPFLRAWNYGLVNFDDYSYLAAHAEVWNWQGLASVRFFLTDVSDAIWMPLTWLSYALDSFLFDEWYGGHHLHSIFVHYVNACLFFFVMWRVFKFGPDRESDRTLVALGCVFAALVWAIHPLRCESVIALSSRKDVLSCFWELIAILFWMRGGFVCTFCMCVCFVLGSACKPSIMTLPILCLLIDAFAKREIRPYRYVFPVGYMLFLAVFAGWQQKMGGATVDMFGQPFWARLVGACAAFGTYLRDFIYPADLAVQCVKTWPAFPKFWIQGVVLSVLTVWWLYRRFSVLWTARRDAIKSVQGIGDLSLTVCLSIPFAPVLLGALWFCISLAPLLGIVSFGYHSHADRFTYVPSMGLSMILAVAIVELAKRTDERHVICGCVTALLAFGALTWRQAGFWHDDGRLMKHTLAVDGDHNFSAHAALAGWYFEFPHDLDGCIREYERALSLMPSYVAPCFAIYVIALCENGQEDCVWGRIESYVEGLRRTYGDDYTRKILEGSRDVAAEHRLYRYVYVWSKIAMWLYEKDGLSAAEDLIAGEEHAEAADQPVWLYLKMILSKRKRDGTSASHYREELRRSSRKHGYFRFRYLQ